MNILSEKEKVTVSEFSKEMDRIEEIQNKVGKIIYSKNPLVRFFWIFEAMKLHNEAEEAVLKLFKKELIEDPQ